MKKSIHPILIAATCWLLPSASYSIEDSDSLGLPGDNFDLYGAMEVFKNSESLEAFEKELNTEKNGINNLDLNADGDIDYVRVVDHMDGDAHAITIEVPVSESEAQTLAVFEIEKNGDDNAGLQLVGDEDMYGADYIIEPYEEETEKSTEMPFAAPRVRIVVNVWSWRPIRFIYAPRYTVWASPWRWAHYPRWYRPWRPVSWRVHHTHCNRYRVHRVHRVRVHRHVRAHKVYRSNRVHSATAHRNHQNRTQHHGPKNTAAKKNTQKSKAKTPKNNQKAKVNAKRSNKKASTKKSNHNTTRGKASQAKTKSQSKSSSRNGSRSSGGSRSGGSRSSGARR